MKIARISTIMYGQAVKKFYCDYPNIDKESYDSHLDLFLKYCSPTGGSFVKCMEKFGYDAKEYFFDLHRLQNKWLVERGGEELPKYDINSSYLRYRFVETICEQLNVFKPDILILEYVNRFEGGEVAFIRERVPSVRCVIARHGCPPYFASLAGVDLVLGCQPGFIDPAYTFGLPSGVWYHCFDEALLNRVPVIPEKDWFLSFSGSAALHDFSTRPRIKLLIILALLTDIILELYEEDRPLSARSQDIQDEVSRLLAIEDLALRRRETLESKIIASIETREELPRLVDLFPDRVRSPVFGSDLMHSHARSQVVLTCHTPTALGTVGNMRLFEATGMGACVLVENGANLPVLFEAGREVVAYNGIEDLLDKIDLLRQEPERAVQIARAGQVKTLRDHTYHSRSAALHELIQAALNRAPPA